MKFRLHDRHESISQIDPKAQHNILSMQTELLIKIFSNFLPNSMNCTK